MSLDRIQKLRDALERIARFNEAFAEAITKHHEMTVPLALVVTLAKDARATLDEDDRDAKKE